MIQERPWKGGKMKNEKVKEKIYNVVTTIKFFTLIFVNEKGYILLKNIVWENVVYTITFLVKMFETK